MTCINPIGPGPAGFRLAETKPAPKWSNWADPLASRTVWTRPHHESGFSWVIPLRRNGDWSGLMHKVRTHHLQEAEQ